jgi:hypothetical protein
MEGTRLATLLPDLLATDAAPILLRHAAPDQYDRARRAVDTATYHARSGLVVLRRSRRRPAGQLAVVSAGTADLPVADEAAAAADALGLAVVRLTDVGVAGLHRLLAHRTVIERATCLIVVAGMDGALPSMVARGVTGPVIAVPTSIGYGSSLDGLAALLALLHAEAPGMAVVGIDDGVGAALVAHRILVRTAPPARIARDKTEPGCYPPLP